jgi:hypothetical protein
MVNWGHGNGKMMEWSTGVIDLWRRETVEEGGGGPKGLKSQSADPAVFQSQITTLSPLPFTHLLLADSFHQVTYAKTFK